MTFAEVIALMREREGRTQAELADLAGFGRTSVANIESGLQEPTLYRLERLAEALHAELSFSPRTGWEARRLPRETSDRAALDAIYQVARWYADNSDRLPHEVDHALCVEVLLLASTDSQESVEGAGAAVDGASSAQATRPTTRADDVLPSALNSDGSEVSGRGGGLGE